MEQRSAGAVHRSLLSCKNRPTNSREEKVKRERVNLGGPLYISENRQGEVGELGYHEVAQALSDKDQV